MTKQGIHCEAHPGDLSPLRPADESDGPHDRAPGPIPSRWRPGFNRTRARRDEMREVGADLAASAARAGRASAGSPATEAVLEFGRFSVLLRQRQLIADGAPVELGTRAFDLLLALLEADGSLVAKDELISRVWPGIVVAEENLKVQVFALRKALGEDRDLIRTEFGRGYRFTAEVSSTVAATACNHAPRRSGRTSHWLIPHCSSRRRRG